MNVLKQWKTAFQFHLFFCLQMVNLRAVKEKPSAFITTRHIKTLQTLLLTKMWPSVATVLWLLSSYVVANRGCCRELEMLINNEQVQIQIWQSFIGKCRKEHPSLPYDNVRCTTHAHSLQHYTTVLVQYTLHLHQTLDPLSTAATAGDDLLSSGHFQMPFDIVRDGEVDEMQHASLI